MALQQRQERNRVSFEKKNFRVLIFEPDELSQGRLVHYLKGIKINGVARFSRVECASTVRAAEAVVRNARITEPIHLVLVMFEHPTLEELDLVKKLQPCTDFPVVALYAPGAYESLKESIDEATKYGLYDSFEAAYSLMDLGAKNYEKQFSSINAAYTPITFTSAKNVDNDLGERILRILYRVHVAQREFDVVFGDRGRQQTKLQILKQETEEAEAKKNSVLGRKKKKAFPAKVLVKKKKVTKKRADSIVKAVFGSANPDIKEKIKGKMKMLRLSSWHKRFGRRDSQEMGATKKKGITNSLKRKIRRKSIVAKVTLQKREPTEAPRDVLQETFLEISVSQARRSYSDSHLHDGLDCMKDRNYRRAVHLFSTALVKDPDHFNCRFFRAVAYGIVGRYRWGRADMILCLNKEPENLVCRYNLALLSLNCHMHRRAARHLKIAGELVETLKEQRKDVDPAVRDAIWKLRGLVNRRRGAYNEARKDYVSLYHVNEHEDLAHYHEDEILYRTKMTSTLTKRDENSFSALLSSLQSAVLTEGEFRTRDELQIIAIFLHKFHFYTKLSAASQRLFCKVIQYEVFEPGNCIYKAGDPSDGFHIVMSGSVTQKLPMGSKGLEHVVNHFFSGDTFGALETLDQKSRINSVYVREAAELLWVNRIHFESIGLDKVFSNTIEYKKKIIKDSGIFAHADIPESFYDDCAKASIFKSYDPGTAIVKQGRKPSSLFFIVQGIAKIVQKADESEEFEYQKRKLQEEYSHFEQNYNYHHKTRDTHLKESGSLLVKTNVEKKIEKKGQQLQNVTKRVRQLKDAERTRRMKAAGGNIWGGLALFSNKKKEEEKKPDKECEIGKLMPPSFFGHTAILSSQEVERANIIAETRVITLRLYASHLDFTYFTGKFLKRLMMRTPVKVLGFNSLVKRCKFEAGWEKMQKNMILEIPKGKWDLKNATVQSVAGGKFAVLPKPKRHGVI